MSKKKTVAATQPAFTPEKYIKEKARTLPIGQCLIRDDWKEAGEAVIVVPRVHKQGNYTFGIYLVDLYCRGVVYSFYNFNVDAEKYRESIDRLGDGRFVDIGYEEVHNLIYGAIAFAEEGGINPDKSYQLTQYILEEDTDDIPLIEYEFGRNGQHLLVVHDKFEASKYLPVLKKTLGNDFKYIIGMGGEEYDGDEEYDEVSAGFKDALERLSAMAKRSREMPHSPYLYEHPAYPSMLETANQKLVPILFDPANTYAIPEPDIAEILSYPHDSLIRDLEQIALYDIGCTCDEIPQKRLDGEFYSPLMHVCFFLGAVHGDRSLQVVLEMMRQNSDCFEYHFGDSADEIFVPTLYLLGKDRLNDLMSFAKEPGLYSYARCWVFPAVTQIIRMQPERRTEVLDWFREVLVFYTETIASLMSCDGILAGLIISDLLDMEAVELLPEIQALYRTGCVDEDSCGSYAKVERYLLSGSWDGGITEYSFDIYERYKDYQKKWDR